ncbi:hypothetical protein HORM4_790115 [Vibrio harveyi]|nr:hypothetical protein HORM4_790115 [Vibrio harveyi]
MANRFQNMRSEATYNGTSYPLMTEN